MSTESWRVFTWEQLKVVAIKTHNTYTSVRVCDWGDKCYTVAKEKINCPTFLTFKSSLNALSNWHERDQCVMDKQRVLQISEVNYFHDICWLAKLSQANQNFKPSHFGQVFRCDWFPVQMVSFVYSHLYITSAADVKTRKWFHLLNPTT